VFFPFPAPYLSVLPVQLSADRPCISKSAFICVHLRQWPRSSPRLRGEILFFSVSSVKISDEQ
jgi:hypothetical protein